MDATFWALQQMYRLAQTIKPSDTFFFFNRDAGRIDFPFEDVGAFEFSACPEFYDNPSGTPREVIARLECIKIPQLTLLPFDLSFLFPHADVVPVYPMISGLSL